MTARSFLDRWEGLKALYAPEIEYLRGRNWYDVGPDDWGGGCVGISARCGHYYILATDADQALVRDDETEESTGWTVCAYDSRVGSIEIAIGEATSFAEAFTNAMDALPDQ